MTSLATVVNWDAGSLVAIARRFQSVARLLEEVGADTATAISQLPAGSFEGYARDMADSRINEQANQLTRDAHSVQRLGSTIDTGAKRVGDSVEKLRQEVRKAENEGFTVDPTTGAVAMPDSPSAPGGATAPGAYSEFRLLRMMTLGREISEALQAAIDADAQFGRVVENLVPDSMQLNAGAVDFAGLSADQLRQRGLSAAEIRSIQHVLAGSVEHLPVSVIEASPGHSAVVFGDMSTADTVVTLVPGTSSRSDDVARQVDRVTSIIGNQDNTAVVLWSYDAPENLTKAASAQYYESAALRLQNFQSGLAEAGVPKQIVTGYSYGSTVVAQATTGAGLHADQVLLAASPGAGRTITTVGDMRLLRNDGSAYGPADTRERVGVATSKLDPIRLASGARVHGADVNSEEFGATLIDINEKSEHLKDSIASLREIPSAHTEHYFGDPIFASETEKWARSHSGSGPG